jgi:Glycosyl hydrolases family 2, TIM barrel domain/Glycosyl hydrolases family 2, sugar binding domain/Glycosyl hydrolases family 2/Beta galactosidase small chain
MKKIIHIVLLLLVFFPALFAQQTILQYLSGTDKDHTIQWDFFCTKGMNSGRWSKIAVPSNWEQQSFGGYSYGNDKIKTDEQGLYKYSFSTAKDWSNKKIFIVFEGSMTDTEVKINGKPAGAVHQGGFYRFKYDITGLLKYGSNNLLEVTVSKMSAQASVNKAERNGDFWTLGGIYRPVYLEIVPQTFIDRVAINAKADGSFSMDVYAMNVNNGNTIEAQVQTLTRENIGNLFSQAYAEQTGKFVLSNQFKDPALWNPEFPNLYQVVVSIKNNGKTIHSITQKFGFRTAALRVRDGFYVNGTKVIFKGVCRHSEWPETGRTLSKEISLLDINLMKEMNMNAVRMSHYPPDQHFLDICDSLGLFVLDELTGWQAAYDTIAGRPLVKELVVRDVNHPSVVIWDNGNEGGWNRALDNDYALYDPQKRLVIHPWEKFNGTDTKHYPDYNYVVNSTLYGQDVFFPTEFMHGLYDGGLGAGLDDFWNLMLQHPYGAGGFLWVFHDEGIVRKDRKDSIDTDGNHAPDGIVGPHREKEASFYTIKEIWSPVYIKQRSIMPAFNGKLEIENRYLYTNLNQCSFKWKLGVLPAANYAGTSALITDSGSAFMSLAPAEKGLLSLNLPASWSNKDVLYLSAYDPYKKEIFTWSWALQLPATVAKRNNITQHRGEVISSAISTAEEDSSFIVLADSIHYYFNKKTGCLLKVINSQSAVSLSNGPVVAGVAHTLKELKHYAKDDQYIVEPVYEGESLFLVKWIFTPGQFVKLEYTYAQKGGADFMGISFDYPEEKITGMKWMGRGPYRVWKNRLKGQQFGIWEKKYNNSITGESWQYPEFKGYHAEVYWAVIETKESSFRIYNENEGMFLQMLKPVKPVGAYNDNVSPPFPEGNIGLMNAISPIGTKFQSADKIGPQSQKNMQLNYAPISGSVWFDFRPALKGY